MIKEYSRKHDAEVKLSENFTVIEFACKDGSDKILIDTDLVKLLQKIRDHFKKSVSITSAYRNADYNKKIGGATSSQHIKGTAADIVVEGVSPLEVAKYAEYILKNSGGIGYYPNFTHVDVREKRARWQDFGKEKAVSGFYGYQEEAKKLESGNDIIWELKNGKHKVEIKEVDKAVKALDKAKDNPEFNSLYWILYKVVNGNG